MDRKTARLFIAWPLLFLAPLSHAADLSTDAWLRYFTVSLPPALCEKGTVLRSCYSVTYEQCEQSVTSAMWECIHNVKLPKFIRSEGEAEKFGGDIGGCAADSFTTANKQRKVSNQDCRAALKKASDEAGQNK